MKVLLVALNSKYIHSNLAIYSLKSYAEKRVRSDLEIAEYTINQPIGKIRDDICRKRADVLFISCYIWNRNEVEALVSDLGKIYRNLNIWLGGPEVSFDATETLREMPSVKGIIRGEGEESLRQLICHYENPDNIGLAEIENITYRENEEIIENKLGDRMDMGQLDFVYNDLADFENRILYYESSRGCPFRCSYCLSSVDKKLSFVPLEKVKVELKFFLDQKVPQVKFIDRTFNCSHERSKEIWRFIRDNDNGITNFHFEIAADIIDDEEIDILQSLRPGLIQLEIGVQSTYEPTIKEINRPMDFGRVSENVRRIMANGNVHVHLDLIAGLPYEGFDRFRKSFNDVFSLRPHQLQLGFLKVLKGSPMAAKCKEYGLEHSNLPPYEVLCTNWMTHDELMKLKQVEEMVDVYYNSGQFTKTIDLILQKHQTKDAFGLFEELAEWYERQNIEMVNLSRNSRYQQLLAYCDKRFGRNNEIFEAVIFDYYARDNVKNRPEFLGKETASKEFLKEFYRRESEAPKYLKGPEFEGADIRRLRHITHIERFDDKYIIFNYMKYDPITGNAEVIIM